MYLIQVVKHNQVSQLFLNNYIYFKFKQVAQDETGQSKGYGFVHFEMEQSATQSIEKVNGMLLNGKKVFVGRFVGRKDREKELGQKAKLYTNVYIKNIDENVNDKELFEMFEKYGSITSFKVIIHNFNLFIQYSYLFICFKILGHVQGRWKFQRFWICGF